MLSTDNRAELGDILTDIGDYLDDNPPALSLPPAAYTSSELWQLERERIFNRSWMLVAHVDQVAKTGDYVTVSVAGEPVMVVRDVDGQLHASFADLPAPVDADGGTRCGAHRHVDLPIPPVALWAGWPVARSAPYGRQLRLQP